VRILVDVDRCTGHALCQGRAPHVFVLDELGYQAHEVIEVPEGSEDAARAAVLACPEQAMRIDE